MASTIELLETKLKKHNWNWSNDPDPDVQVRGKNNFMEIARLMQLSKDEGNGEQAKFLYMKYNTQR